MKRPLILPLLLMNALCVGAAYGQSTAKGKALHDANCTSCHDTSVYTRTNRMVKSIDALGEQVNSCTHMASVTLTPEQHASLVQYLNEQFYKFK